MRLFAIPLALAALTLPALAQETMSGHDMNHMASGAEAPSTEAFLAANSAMHDAMMIEFTGNADIDFVRGMIGHHQGAVAMAKIELEYGTDPEVRKLAENIIAAQEAEIAWMQEWLAKHGQ
ncbi:DUF305 domain-containing protein [Tabrizicola sp. J26]|uniref:CopM family metallochaperone n=1 Tax=Alitabrizicola rongguiensis TaxID=2909234 RepID=UPI001F28FF24|nr:DUF305 domain-containing protein [Tabrizicola rongguiensis]MCF1710934.1 DUF305 domain-containing protein [Tabrizicola rongguiensis]